MRHTLKGEFGDARVRAVTDGSRCVERAVASQDDAIVEGQGGNEGEGGEGEESHERVALERKRAQSV
jgi:hypothetical protein